MDPVSVSLLVLLSGILALLIYLVFRGKSSIDINCNTKPEIALHPNNPILLRTKVSDHKYILTEKMPYLRDVAPPVYVDYERPFKDATTSFVVDEFFATDDTLFDFLYLVITTHENALKEYKVNNGLVDGDIIFIYKGGHLLRIIANEMFKHMPLKSATLLSKYYGSSIKRNDADFSIYINTNKFPLHSPSFNKIVRDVGDITYNLQKDYRTNTFLPQARTYFNFFRYDEDYQIEKLNNHVAAYANNSAIDDASNEVYYNAKIGGLRIISSPNTNPPNAESKYWNSVASDSPQNLPVPATYKGKMDLIITPDHTSPTGVDITTDTNTVWPIYVQHNTTLNFVTGDNIVHSFDLMRSKVVIDYERSLYDQKTGTYSPYETYGIGGELIDVSIGKDEAVEELFEDINLNVKQYTLTRSDKELVFYGYSIKYLVDDLTIMLFVEVAFPWNNRKYDKRLYRLVFLCFTEVMSIFKTLKDKIFYLKYMLFNIYKPLTEEGVNIANVAKAIKDLKTKYPLLLFNLLLDPTMRMLTGVIPEDEKADYIQYNNNIVQNLSVLLQSIDDIGEYICDQGTVNMDTLYIGSFDSLV